MHHIIGVLLLLMSLGNHLPDTSSIETGATAPTTLAVSQFNTCNTQDTFSTQPWYPFLLSALSKDSFYTSEDAERIWEMNKEQYTSPDEVIEKIGMIKSTNITRVCYAANTNLVLASVSDYMIRGRIFVYDVTPKILSDIPLDVATTSKGESFMEFGKQVGTMLPVITRFGDGLGSSETIYNLDLTKLTLTPVSSKSCEYDLEKEENICEPRAV